MRCPNVCKSGRSVRVRGGGVLRFLIDVRGLRLFLWLFENVPNGLNQPAFDLRDFFFADLDDRSPQGHLFILGLDLQRRFVVRLSFQFHQVLVPVTGRFERGRG